MRVKKLQSDNGMADLGLLCSQRAAVMCSILHVVVHHVGYRAIHTYMQRVWNIGYI